MIVSARNTVAALVALCSLVGCQSSKPTEAEAISLDLTTAENRWKNAGLVNYDFESTSLCFCNTEYVGPLRVSVRGGRVTTIVNTKTGAAAPLTYRGPMDSVFAFVRLESATRLANLTVTYDAALGYPRRIAYGTLANDNGGIITIEGLRAALP